MSEADRINALEEKFAFQQRELEQLSEALGVQHKAVDTLEKEVAALREALRRVAQSSGGELEILGAYGGDDPVPSSG